MSRHFIRPLACLLFLLHSEFSTNHVSAQQIALEEFRELVEKGTAAFDNYYQNVGMRIEYHSKFVAASDKFKSREESIEYEYVSRKPFFRLKTLDKSLPNSPTERTSVVNKDGCYRLNKAMVEGNYFLQRVLPDCAEVTDAILYYARLPLAGFSSRGAPIRGYLAADDWTVSHEDGLYRAQRKLMVNGKPCERQIIFDPQKLMALIKYEDVWPDTRITEIVEFEGEDNGVPLIRRVELNERDTSGIRRDVWEVTEWLKRPFTDDDFSLTQHGIPTPVPQPSGLPFWFYALFVFLACLILASVFARVAKRRSKR